jgi:hypothetical protein
VDARVNLVRDDARDEVSSTRMVVVVFFFFFKLVELESAEAAVVIAAAAARFFLKADRLRFSLYCAISISICFSSSLCDWSAARLA